MTGDQLEQVIVVPRGMEPDFPIHAAEKLGELQEKYRIFQEKYDQLTEEKEKLEEQLAVLQKEYDALSKKYDELQQAEQKRIEESLSEMRKKVAQAKVAANLLSEEKIEEYTKTLGGLDMEQLSVLLSDYQAIKPSVSAVPAGERKEQVDLSDIEKQEEQLREQLFGHKEPAELYHKEA